MKNSYSELLQHIGMRLWHLSWFRHTASPWYHRIIVCSVWLCYLPYFFFLICKLAHAFTQQGWPQRKLICLPSGFPEDHNYATIKLCFKVTWSHHFPDCFSHLSVDKCTIMLHLENLASPILPTSSFQFSGVTVSIASMMVCRRLNIKSPMSNLF